MWQVNTTAGFRKVIRAYRHVVPNKVPVALIGVELDGESTSVAKRFWGARLVHHSGEPGNQGSLAANL